MSVLSNEKIEEYLNNGDLIITPILDPEKQIGSSTIDLRLGSKFRVDLKTRMPFIDPLNIDRPMDTFFDETYRDFGDKFLLYPGQLVLASTFEYIKLPNNIFGMLFTRSSWNRLGLSVSTVIQPGYAGVLTFELTNNSSNPIAIYPGIRFGQLILHELVGNNEIGYLSSSQSKYIADSEPSISNILYDKDFHTIKTKFPY